MGDQHERTRHSDHDMIARDNLDLPIPQWNRPSRAISAVVTTRTRLEQRIRMGPRTGPPRLATRHIAPRGLFPRKAPVR